MADEENEGRARPSGRRAKQQQVVGDPMIPSRDGPLVAKNGGMIFIIVCWGLIAIAIVGQLVIGK